MTSCSPRSTPETGRGSAAATPGPTRSSVPIRPTDPMAITITIIFLASWSLMEVRNVRRRQALQRSSRISNATEGKVMKEKDTIKGEELETINSELFDAFDPEDVSWIGGSGSKTVTSWITYTPSGPEA